MYVGLSEEELLCKSANQQDTCKTISSTIVQGSKAPTARMPHKDINNAASLGETARVISEAAVEVNTIRLAHPLPKWFARQPQPALHILTFVQIRLCN